MTEKYSHMNPSQIMWFEGGMFLIGPCFVCRISGGGTALKTSRRWDLAGGGRSLRHGSGG